jgi:hypothetical protein
MTCNRRSYKIRSEVPYLCYDSRKIPYRKTTGSPEKIAKSIEKFMDNLYASFVQDYKSGKLTDYDMALAERKGYT